MKSYMRRKKDFDDIAEILAKYTKLDKNSIEILE